MTSSGFTEVPRNEPSWAMLERIVRDLHAASTDQQLALDTILTTALDAIDPADDAGIILLEGGALVPRATTGTAPHELDVYQQQTGSGPCITAAEEQAVTRIDTMAGEQRWPAFAERAQALNVQSMLCVPLWIGYHRLGTLSLYSGVPAAFSDDDLQLTRLFAAHAALTLADVARTEQFTSAVSSRDVIGQAKGILMERRRLTSEDAFSCLVLASQAANLKLALIADHLVNTGELIGIDTLAG